MIGLLVIITIFSPRTNIRVSRRLDMPHYIRTWVNYVAEVTGS